MYFLLPPAIRPGAGIQADLLTIASIGCHPLSVITAITVQDTVGVEDVMPFDAEWITAQARAVLEDMPVHAFKLGLLGSVEIIAAIAEIVADYPEIPLIMDPILASGRGDPLVDDRMIDAMRTLLLPQVTLLTPNSLEARQLAHDDSDHSENGLDLTICAQRLLDMGCEHVLITGTHENSVTVKTLCIQPQAKSKITSGKDCRLVIMVRVAHSLRRLQR